MASSTFDVNVSVSPTWSYEWTIIIVNSKQEFDDMVEHAWVATVHEITSKSMKDDGVCVEGGAPDCVKDLTVTVQDDTANGTGNKRLIMDHNGKFWKLRFNVQLVDNPNKFPTQELFHLYMVDVVKRTMSVSQGAVVLATYNKYLVQFGGVIDTSMEYVGTFVDSYAATASPSVSVSDGVTSTSASSSSSSSAMSSGMIAVVVIVPVAALLLVGIAGMYFNKRLAAKERGNTNVEGTARTSTGA